MTASKVKFSGGERKGAYQLARLLDCRKPARFWKEPSLGTKAVSLPLCGIATAVQNRRLRREFRENAHGILDCAGRARATSAPS